MNRCDGCHAPAEYELLTRPTKERTGIFACISGARVYGLEYARRLPTPRAASEAKGRVTTAVGTASGATPAAGERSAFPVSGLSGRRT